MLSTKDTVRCMRTTFYNRDYKMNQDSPGTHSDSSDEPLTDFSDCHVAITRNLELLKSLASTEITDSKETRKTAKSLLSFFKATIPEHHGDEEEELFPAVRDCAAAGREAEKSRLMIDQLIIEHRQLEALWAVLSPQLKQLSKGNTASLNCETALKLAHDYAAHARFEEEVFLPLSEKILKNNGMSALGLSLHMRHSDDHLQGYI